ncbi:hypothetical protein CEK26_011152 [Fusarium fujikuroi]|nr:hypothetical protein CEK26_011152 [Fusarium fujikuroi]
MAATAVSDQTTDLSKQYDTPLGLAHSTMQVLKDRIKLHYDLASDYYLSLWGEHIHHGYWPTPESEATQTKEEAQTNLIQLLLDISKIPSKCSVLDVGCGIGGTSRYLASKHGSSVTGITISSKQVEIANRLTKTAIEDTSSSDASDDNGFTKFGEGNVKFLELDAEEMGDFFSNQQGTFDAQGYVNLANKAGLKVLSEPKDISQQVRKTWDITWSLVQNPSLWAFAITQGRDGIAFLQSFRAMRRGYANGSFRYAVMGFYKEMV